MTACNLARDSALRRLRGAALGAVARGAFTLSPYCVAKSFGARFLVARKDAAFLFSLAVSEDLTAGIFAAELLLVEFLTAEILTAEFFAEAAVFNSDLDAASFFADNFGVFAAGVLRAGATAALARVAMEGGAPGREMGCGFAFKLEGETDF